MQAPSSKSRYRAFLFVLAMLAACGVQPERGRYDGDRVGRVAQAVSCIAEDAAAAAQPWKVGTHYKTGNLVRENGTTYSARIEHDADATSAPNGSSPVWGIPPLCGVHAWAADTSYDAGDIVEHDGKLYQAVVTHTSQQGMTPDRAASLWRPFDPAAMCPAYDPDVFGADISSGPSAPLGTIPGGFAVSPRGSATYQIALSTPPGRNQIEPRLAIAYDSDRGDGLLGVGFSLQGISAIARCRSIAPRDGIRREVRYDASDKFCLDGIPLVAIEGEYGGDGTEYRTLPDSFARIRSYSNGREPEAGPTTFHVWRKDGRIVEYGGRPGAPDDVPSSRIRGQGAVLRAWAASREFDRVGNYIEYTYENLPSLEDEGTYTAEYMPHEIRYTGHEPDLAPQRSILFSYVPGGRTVNPGGYSKGMQLFASQVLNSVTMRVGGRVVRTYYFGYEKGVSLRTRLASIRECADTCMPATRFAWNDFRPNVTRRIGFESISTALSRLSSRYIIIPGLIYDIGDDNVVLDLNGDGTSDLMTHAGGTIFYDDDADTYRIRVSLGNALNSHLPSFALQWQRTGQSFVGLVTQATTVPIDYNQDGREDLIRLETLDVLLSNGTTLNPPQPTGIPKGVGKPQFVDLDGDGNFDLVQCVDNTHWQARLFGMRPNGQTGFGAPMDIPQMDGADCNNEYRNVLTMDVNGDGAGDLLVARPAPEGTGQRYAAVRLEAGAFVGPTFTTLAFPTPNPDARREYRILDVNGDGLEDIVTSDQVGSGLQVHLNTGLDFADQPVLSFVTPEVLRGAVVIDVNADGMMDLVVSSTARFDTGNWRILQSVRNGFLPLDSDISNTEYSFLQRLSLDGTASSGMVGYSNFDGIYRVFRNRVYQADLLASMDDGLQGRAPSDPRFVHTVSVNYAPLIDRDTPVNADFVPFYKPRQYSNCTYPVACAIGGRQVVDRYAVSTGGYFLNDLVQGDSPRLHKMLYRDGRLDRRGWGWLGFSSVVDVSTILEPTYSRTTYYDEIVSGQFFDNVTYDPATGRYPGVGRPEYEWQGVPNLPFGDPDFSALRSAQCDTKQTHYEYSENGEYDGRTYFVFNTTQDRILANDHNCLAPIRDSFRIDSRTTTTRLPDAHGNQLLRLDNTEGTARRALDVAGYQNDEGPWLISAPTGSVDCGIEGTSVQCRSQSHDVDPVTGLVRSTTIEPSDPAHQLKTTFDRDAYGNVISVLATETRTGRSRARCTSYETSEYIFPFASDNLANVRSYSKYDPTLGTMKQQVDANQLSARWAYDGFGRVVEEVLPDGSSTTVTLGSVVDDGETRIESTVTSSDGSSARVQFDTRGRLRKRFNRVVGRTEPVMEEMKYDGLGRIPWHRLPAPESAAPGDLLIERKEYDGWGRPMIEIAPDRATTYYSYLGFLSTFVQDPNGHATNATRDATGRLISTTDAKTGKTLYTYRPFDALYQTTDPDGHVTTMESDAYGRLVLSSDADRGSRTSSYNAFGQPETTTDAKGQTTTYFYDSVGRKVAAARPEGISHWTWDPSAYGVGKLAVVRSPSGAVETYGYDSSGRPSETSLAFEGNTYSTILSYDALGRPDTMTYPGTGTPLQVLYGYDDAGHMTSVRDADGRIYWQWLGSDDSGRVTLEGLADGAMRTRRSYDDAKGGVLSSTATYATRGPLIQGFSYGYDGARNLTGRADNVVGRAETFCYDELNRLTDGSSMGSVVCGEGPDFHYEYAADGNLLYKNDVGTLTYRSDRPHQVLLAGDYLYGHDANGNQVLRPDTAIVYNAADKPRVYLSGSPRGFDPADPSCSIIDVNATRAPASSCACAGASAAGDPATFCADRAVVLTYDANDGRVKKSTPRSDTTYAANGTFQRVVEKDDAGETTSVAEKSFIQVFGGMVAVVTRTSTVVDGPIETTTRYFHTDNLGSIATITDEAGTVVERRRYDPYGAATEAGSPGPRLETHGFTGHEEDGEVGLINMIGRAYDPWLARFLSPDPIVSHPKSTQSWNPYTYVQGNPLRMIDVSGYQAGSAYPAYGGYGTLSPGSAPPTYSGTTTLASETTSFVYEDVAGQSMSVEFSPETWVIYGAAGNNAGGGALYLPSPESLALPDGNFYFDSRTQFTLDSSAAHASFKIAPVPTEAPTPPDLGPTPQTLPAGGNPLVGAGKELWNEAISIAAVVPAILQMSSPSAWESGPAIRDNLEAQKFSIENRGEAVGAAVVFIVGAVVGPEAEAVTAAEGVKTAYSVAFETMITATGTGVRRAHNRAANRALLGAMSESPELATAIKNLGIEVPTTASGAARGASPAGWTWHHAVEPGVMQLVPRTQHTAGGPYWGILHPLTNYGGGYSKWGIDY
jgi:RHS repeat-associated protein